MYIKFKEIGEDMKHEVTTLNTKRSLAASLKFFMERKPFSKISVSDIISDCGVNRKTFYYHFQDKYDLLKWMLEEEAIQVVRQFDLLIDYREAVIFVMNYVRENKHLLSCAYDSIGRDEMKLFFYTDFIGITKQVVDNTEEQLGVHVEPQFKEFLLRFYTEAIAGLLISEFTSEEAHNPETAASYFELILKSSLPTVLQSAQVAG